ncbi:MAG: tetratricopeptide repeat protein [Deltaproteobacteria bacterium]|nr:tetratricopeptide repeat protein [Deltaproteobacteria bacterium]
MDPRRPVGSLVLLLTLAAAAPPTTAQPLEPQAGGPPAAIPGNESTLPDPPPEVDPLLAEAGRRFDLGVAYYDEGRYDAALAEFLRTYEITGEWSVLYNLGQVCRALGRNADAVGYFERYLALGAADIDPDRRAEVQAALDSLQPLVARIRIDVVIDGAVVFVDGVERGATPLPGPLLVDPGSHAVEVRDDRLPGGRERREIILAGGLTELLEVVVPTSVPPPPLPPLPEEEGSVWASWWLWTIVGVVVLGGAVTTGVLLWPRDTTYSEGSVPPIVLSLGSW